MNKLYRKSEIWFAVAWIIVYIVGTSIADNLHKAVTLALHLGLTVLAMLWVCKNDLLRKYGLCKPSLPAKCALFYIPLIICVSCNLWFGVQKNMSVPDTLLFVGSMLCVGFLEEFIFRGLLFRAIENDSVKAAVIVTSLTFGFGHIINLFNGSGMDLLANVGQVVSAVAFGFLFVTIFMKSGTLLICIAAHSTINALSAFAVSPSPIWDLITALILTVIAASYALILWKNPPQKQ
jgi:membrane protease YdiL (CAAX protease family)